jgi:hypothetical protein
MRAGARQIEDSKQLIEHSRLLLRAGFGTIASLGQRAGMSC